MTRCLPANWPIDITYAENGREGLEIIRAGKGELVFLDLNMPEMDGYDVLREIQSQDLPAMAIVVSGDVQEEAYVRVKQLGALEFIQKPVSPEQIVKILRDYGIHDSNIHGSGENGKRREESLEVHAEEAYQELANIALGRAVKLLAQYLDVFVEMSLPHASHLALGELHMALEHISINDKVSAVSQGFVGGGIAGEALLMFNDSNTEKIANLLHYDKEINADTRVEVLVDIANILIGACLSGISEQLDLRLSQGHPQILDCNAYIGDILIDKGTKPALTIEMGCSIKSHDVDIELLLMFTDESISILNSKLNYMLVS
jgi:chemotaxis protein CheY-P-specific phosphatase CheC